MQCFYVVQGQEVIGCVVCTEDGDMIQSLRRPPVDVGKKMWPGHLFEQSRSVDTAGLWQNHTVVSKVEPGLTFAAGQHLCQGTASIVFLLWTSQSPQRKLKNLSRSSLSRVVKFFL